MANPSYLSLAIVVTIEEALVAKPSSSQIDFLQGLTVVGVAIAS